MSTQPLKVIKELLNEYVSKTSIGPNQRIREFRSDAVRTSSVFSQAVTESVSFLVVVPAWPLFFSHPNVAEERERSTELFRAVRIVAATTTRIRRGRTSEAGYGHTSSLLALITSWLWDDLVFFHVGTRSFASAHGSDSLVCHGLLVAPMFSFGACVFCSFERK